MFQDPTRSHWLHEKTEATASNGMVSSRHPLSAEAGVEILKRGGNAVDAIVAASFAESVVQPAASTIGGGGLFSVRFPDGRAHGINYMWETPGAARADMFPLEGKLERHLFGWSGVKDDMNEIGGLAVATPGSVAGLVKANAMHGRLPLAEVMAPAVRLARDGFEMDWYGTLMSGIHLDIMKRFPITAETFLRDGQYPFRPNMIGAADLHRQPRLAETLETIAAEGAEVFYKGPIATSIVEAVKNGGGILTLEDLSQYQAEPSEPRSFQYRGNLVQGEPSGVTIYGQLVNVLSHFDLGAYQPNSVERLHLLIEVIRHCHRDRMLVAPDGRTLDGPTGFLATPDYAQALAKQINLKARSDIPSPWAERTNEAVGGASRTVHIAAIDGEGCVASLTETVIGNYGSFITSDTGVLLNNGMIGLAPLPGQPNSIEPRKRTANYISPLHISSPDDGSVMTIGSSGGSKIMTSVIQILSLIIDHNLSPQAAVSHPRIDFEGDLVVLDARIGEGAATALRAMGHEVVLRSEGLSTFEFGNACVIARDSAGVIRAGVNPFQATAAIGF